MGHQLSDTMVRKIHTMLHHAMKTAVQARLIAKNPTEGTTVPKTNEPLNLVEETENQAQEEVFVPEIYIPRRKPGTGCISEINDHLYEGRWSPKWIDGKRISRNVYAKTREECEVLLEQLIRNGKIELAELKRAAQTQSKKTSTKR